MYIIVHEFVFESDGSVVVVATEVVSGFSSAVQVRGSSTFEECILAADASLLDVLYMVEQEFREDD